MDEITVEQRNNNPLDSDPQAILRRICLDFSDAAMPAKAAVSSLTQHGLARTLRSAHQIANRRPNFVYGGQSTSVSPPTISNSNVKSPDHTTTPTLKMAAKNLPAAFNATSQDIEMLLSAQCHLGSKNMQVHMEPYLWKTRADGINILNVGKTWYVAS